jgi:hypothetical protein
MKSICLLFWRSCCGLVVLGYWLVHVRPIFCCVWAFEAHVFGLLGSYSTATRRARWSMVDYHKLKVVLFFKIK